MSYKTKVFQTGDDEFGFSVYLNHTHQQIDVEVIDSEVVDNKPLASLTPSDVKNLIHILSNLDYKMDMDGEY